MEHESDRGFRLEITSLNDFLAFVAAIRNEDPAKLAEFTARLTKKAAALVAAEQQGAKDGKQNPG